MDPGRANEHTALGVALQRLHRPDEASQALATALTLEPDNAYAHRNLAAVLGNLGRMDEAELHFRAAYAAMPRDQATAYGWPSVWRH